MRIVTRVAVTFNFEVAHWTPHVPDSMPQHRRMHGHSYVAELIAEDLPDPYGMVVSSKGVPFFVEFGANKVASIDPVTMAIQEYLLPAEESRPRRIAITSDDVIWYSDYSRGYLGRLDPTTGKVTEWQSPSGPKSEPYGISAINDLIWFSESGSTPNTVVRFDPKTEKFQSWTIRGGGNIVRNTSVTRDGNLVLANSLVNAVTLVRIQR